MSGEHIDLVSEPEGSGADDSLQEPVSKPEGGLVRLELEEAKNRTLFRLFLA